MDSWVVVTFDNEDFEDADGFNQPTADPDSIEVFGPFSSEPEARAFCARVQLGDARIEKLVAP